MKKIVCDLCGNTIGEREYTKTETIVTFISLYVVIACMIIGSWLLTK